MALQESEVDGYNASDMFHGIWFFGWMTEYKRDRARVVTGELAPKEGRAKSERPAACFRADETRI